MKLRVQGKSVFATTGSGEHKPGSASLIFIHGAGMDHSIWVMPARYFARHGYNVLAPDLPGHGMSEGPALQSIEALSDWCFALQDAVSAQQTTYVGHSMGSLVSFANAARHPKRVSRIALLGTSSPMPVSDGLLAAAKDNDHAAIDMANTWSHSAEGALGASGHPGSCNLHTGMRLLERSAAGVLHADLAACNGFSADQFGSVVDTKTLIIAGSADQMTPAKSGLKVASTIPNSQNIVLQGSGHSMLSEQPNEVLDALAQFLLPVPTEGSS